MSSKDDLFEDDEIFDDSTFLANFDNTSFAKKPENNLNESGNNSTLNVSALCCDEEISGYDKLSGKTWIYPTNYPVRDYQFNIIKSAILKNTMVSLPTGLGKTFIAAVIMYNFYRWYPVGKIVFTAPTRPLVAQQIDACYNIIAIPPDDTIEMTGHMQVASRKSHWENKRVFFATPQVIYNDIKSGICPAKKIRCLVMDEAHRARGNYAYCQIVATLDEIGHRTYRMLALSATPGSKVEDVINVVKSLHISHLELRTENCIDVAPYSHSRKINTVIIQLGPELSQLRQQYVEILDGYARRLKQFNILPQNLGNLSKGRIVMLYKDYQNRDRGVRHPQHNYIMKDFTILISLCHGLELLVKHGSRVFLNFFDEHPEKSWIQADDRLTSLLERLRDDLGINPLSLNRSILPDGSIPEMPENLCFGHPKFDKLKNIMMEHFQNAKWNKQDTRAIVFCEYRESVNLVHCLLLQCRPLITPQMFVGQGASGKDGKTVVSQKQQLRVMRSFREGLCNTLVATCVAEEGLDVGSVDLIVCFDISTRSPIRLVQRCGRTGRERGGQVYILVTEGKEHQTLLDCMRQRDGLNKKILQSKEVENNLYKMNPRMMPPGFNPTEACRKMYITVAKKDDKEPKTKKGQKDLRTMLLSKPSSSSSKSSCQSIDSTLITEEQFKLLYPNGYQETNMIRKPVAFCTMNKDTFSSQLATSDKELKSTTWLEWQQEFENTAIIGHSKDTEMLTKILQKRYEKQFEPKLDIPLSPDFISPKPLNQKIIPSPLKTKTKKKQMKSPIKKDGDIRALFSTATKSTKSYTKLIKDLGIPNDGSVPTKLINLLVDLNLDNSKTEKSCYICKNICDCKLLHREKNVKEPILKKFIEELNLPKLDLIDDIDVDSIVNANKIGSQVLPDLITTQDKEIANCSNFDLEFDFEALDEINSPKDENDTEILDKNFDLGDVDDIFAESSPEIVINDMTGDTFKGEQIRAEDPKKHMITDESSRTEQTEVKDSTNVIDKTLKINQIGLEPTETKDALEFFGLDSIEDIFADSDDDNQKSPDVVVITKSPTKNEAINTPAPIIEYPLSPSILTGKTTIPTSPILCSQVKRLNKTKLETSTPNSSKKKLLSDNNVIVIPEENEKDKSVDATNKSMFTITQLVDMINQSDKSIVKNSTINRAEERCTSPILLTQTDKKRSLSLNSSKNKSVNSGTLKNTATQKKSESLIILDSDSDSNDTQIYELDNNLTLNQSNTKSTSGNNVNQSKVRCQKSPVNKQKFDDEEKSPENHKRKFDDEETSSSPYFNKRPKLETVDKPLTIQQKILTAISSNKPKITNNQTNYNVTVSQPNFSKENQNPIKDKLNKSDENIKSSPIKNLQQFRRNNMADKLRNKFDSIFKKNTQKSPEKKLMNFESDDDFVDDKKSSNKISPLQETNYKSRLQFDSSDDDFEKSSPPSFPSKKSENKLGKHISTTNHKVRKKKRKRNSLLDIEAELSDDGSDSGDELTDDSAGSIAEFICDDDITHEDIQAVYLKSVKSPVKKNGFKIPELPKKFNKAEIFSQFIQEDEQDAYEMDSFCVDSHIGLTQANEFSVLELAEMALEQKRRAKKTKTKTQISENNNSPIVKKKNKKKYIIDSDSDSS